MKIPVLIFGYFKLSVYITDKTTKTKEYIFEFIKPLYIYHWQE